jgi:acetyl-CoA C-acetyltransferase
MNKLKDAVIVEVARTPVGKFKQALASFEAPVLAGLVMKAIIERAGINAESVDQVVFANLFNYNWGNIARIGWLEAGLPESVPAISVNRQCASSLDALAYGAALIMAGAAEIILAGGAESYSRQPFLVKRADSAFPPTLETLPYRVSSDGVGDPSMITTAENLAAKYHISREECDSFALESHRKAAAAWDRDFYGEEIVPIAVPQKKGDPLLFSQDECVRRDSSMESLGRLKSVIRDGVVTAGNSSPMNDGASAVLLMDSDKACELGLVPLARVTAFASAGVDPHLMGIGPVYATRKLMKARGLSIDDFDLIELNEAFAAQALACVKELGIDQQKLNPNGGAIAIGHPNAASGGILTARAARHMRDQGLKRGLITFCCGGGQGFSCLLERD